jgi:hypothetical protein
VLGRFPSSMGFVLLVMLFETLNGVRRKLAH